MRARIDGSYCAECLTQDSLTLPGLEIPIVRMAGARNPLKPGGIRRRGDKHLHITSGTKVKLS